MMGLGKLFGWTDPKQVLGQHDDKLDGLFGLANAKQEGVAISVDPVSYQNQMNQLGGMSTATLSIGAMGQQWKPNPDTIPLPMLNMQDLEGPAGKASLEEVQDLWRARWGNAWVKRGEIADNFYTVCAQRLLSADRLEAHELADGTHVYRLLEK
jgi:hypothetical protein